MPVVLDISSLRGKGRQPGEEELPEVVGNAPPAPVMDEAVLAQLQDMGFPIEACKRSIFFTNNSGLENASTWIMEHITDTNFSDPFIPPGTENIFVPDPNSLPLVMGMGFTQEQAVKALKATDNNVERAIDWIFSHPEEVDNASSPGVPEFRDGNGRTYYFRI